VCIIRGCQKTRFDETLFKNNLSTTLVFIISEILATWIKQKNLLFGLFCWSSMTRFNFLNCGKIGIYNDQFNYLYMIMKAIIFLMNKLNVTTLVLAQFKKTTLCSFHMVRVINVSLIVVNSDTYNDHLGAELVIIFTQKY
jgi:hypothetical protein